MIIFISFTVNAQTGMLNATGYAPDFTVTDINGNNHNLYNYLDSGYVMVLELMSVTCGHCIAYAPHVESSYQLYGPNGNNSARFLGLEINSLTDSMAIANFTSAHGGSFPIANNVSPTAINYQLYYTPGFYVVYPDKSYTTFCPAYCVTNSSYSTIENLLNTAISSWTPPVYGCMDSTAINFNPLATVDNDSCDYTSYTIFTNGMRFSPDTVICDVGDTIYFVLGAGHNAVEVSDSTWLAGGAAPLIGGFNFGYGTTTGYYVPDDCHTFYYVCQPHAGLGMKGVIIAHHPPVFGCTDSAAVNYDSTATIDDGSCILPTACTEPVPTGVYSYDIIDERAKIAWDNMNSTFTQSTTHIINSGNYYYSPSSLNINVGDTVVWINDGGYHNVNFDISSITGLSYNNPVSFITNPTTGSNLATYVFTIPGTYHYDCSVGSHAINGMTGSIIVSSNESCMVDKYRIRYREAGTTAWSSKTMQGSGLCLNGLNTTVKQMLNLTHSTTYEYKIKAWYCGGAAGGTPWSATQTFTTKGICPDITNLTVTPNPNNNTRATFCWDTTGTYLYARVKYRIDSVGSYWINVGGFGVYYPTTCKQKFGIVPGNTYKATARAFCDPNMSAYNSNWTPFVTWTQPASNRVGEESSINNLTIYPNPSKDIFNIQFTSIESQSIKVRAINIIGELIYVENLEEFSGEYIKGFNLNKYGKGIYFLEIETRDGVISKKLILQ